jgi:hypothetical protein
MEYLTRIMLPDDEVEAVTEEEFDRAVAEARSRVASRR